MKKEKNEKEVINKLPPPPAPPAQQVPHEQKVKDKLPKNKKIKIGIIVGICAVVIVGLIFLIANLVSNNTKLATPTNLEVVETTTGKTYIYVDKCNGAKKYKFEIFSADNQNPIIYETEKNNFDATLILGKPASYTICCQYIGTNTANTSDYCKKINHTTTKKIATPTVSLGKINNNNVLFVESANAFAENVLLSFSLMYTDGQIQYTEQRFFTEQDKNFSGYLRGYFNLDSIFSTKGKQYQLSVKVSQLVNEGEESFYITSDLSSQVLYTVA